MALIRPVPTGPASIVGRFRSHRPAFPAQGTRWFAGLRAALPKAQPSREQLSVGAANLPQPLGRIGALELKLAERPKEVKRAQRLRYRVFFEEMSAEADPLARLARRDMDHYDTVCDHLLVLDHAVRPNAIAEKLLGGLRGFEIKGVDLKALDLPRPSKPKKPAVVGTYRLLRQEVADEAFGFYTAGEFAIERVIDRHPDLNFLELGRSCVLKPYRDKRTVELLWHGIWAYVLAHGIDVMFGCASLEGTDPQKLALPLSYLKHFHAAPPEWNAPPLPGRGATLDYLPREAIDPRAALRALPPLIKGYLRLGAYIGEAPVVDRQFGCTDVLIVLPRSAINPRYVDYYGADAGRHAA
ncbi:MAG: GNAT family N-acyltransferase [Hansschlegelia sp.]